MMKSFTFLVIKVFFQFHWIRDSLFSKLQNILMVYWSKLHKDHSTPQIGLLASPQP